MALYKVEICGVDTSKLPHMSSKKSTELLNRIKEGDNEAREEFITGNLRLVLSVIQRFSNRGELADDMFQVGCIGLIKAIDNFDTSHGVKFSTYAVPMIIGELRRYLRDNNSLRVSRSLRDTAYKVLQMRSKMLNESDKELKKCRELEQQSLEREKRSKENENNCRKKLKERPCTTREYMVFSVIPEVFL